MTTPEIDKLTLELMMNKSQYKKYLAKREPTKFKEQEEYEQQISDHRTGILEIFTNLLDNPNVQYTHNIENHFECFVKEAIEYIDTQSYIKRETDSCELFPEKSVPVITTSLWGKNIRKQPDSRYIERKEN